MDLITGAIFFPYTGRLHESSVPLFFFLLYWGGGQFFLWIKPVPCLTCPLPVPCLACLSDFPPAWHFGQQRPLATCLSLTKLSLKYALCKVEEGIKGVSSLVAHKSTLQTDEGPWNSDSTRCTHCTSTNSWVLTPC
jgi:hypothetical protein